jgi:hypothetical protein
MSWWLGVGWDGMGWRASDYFSVLKGWFGFKHLGNVL